MNFLSIPDIAVDNPSGRPTLVNKEVAALINLGSNLLKIDLKPLPDNVTFLICALLNFMSVDVLLFIEFRNLVVCLLVKSNSWGFSLLKFLAPNLKVVFYCF